MTRRRANGTDMRRGGWAIFPSAVQATTLVWGSAPGLLLGFLAITLIGAVTPVLVVWLTKLILDRLVSPGPYDNVLALAVVLAVAGLVNAAIPQVGQYLRAELDRRAALRAQDRLFSALQRFTGLPRFEDPVFLDRLRMAEQSASAPAYIVATIFGIGCGLLTLGGLLGSLAVISPLFTTVVLAAGIPTLLVELRLSRRRAAMTEEISPAERRELFYRDLLGTAYAAKEVRLFGLSPFLRGRMNDEQQAANASRRRLDQHELFMQSGLALLSALICGAGLVWVILATDRHHLTVGDVALFIGALSGVQGGLSSLVTSMAGAHHRLLMFGNYLEVNHAEPDLPAPAEPQSVPALQHGIELRDVWFRYSDEHPWVLRGVNLLIPHGRSTALVGHNGSGKSTLVKLLCRFYDPTQGVILWDGVDIRQLHIKQLRERIGAVFQDFVNYDFSAGDNIAMGDLPTLGDPERIEIAARNAGAHEMLAGLPHGYDTLLTRMFFSMSDKDDPHTGVVLSGGQWQRLALARAFLRIRRDLMILDEPSAGLDAEAEADVHTRIRGLRHGRTSLLISHHLGTIRDADLIVVLANGVITEHGRHADLLAANGTYARLFTLQATGYLGNQHARANEHGR